MTSFVIYDRDSAERYRGDGQTFRDVVVAAVKDKVDLREAVFLCEDLSGIDFFEVDLTGAVFCESNLCGSNFEGATLVNTNFTGADLSKSNLSGANFMGADLFCATLTGSTLVFTSFVGVEIQETDLSECVFTNTFFGGVDLYCSDVHGARFLCDGMSEAAVLKVALGSGYVSGYPWRAFWVDNGARNRDEGILFGLNGKFGLLSEWKERTQEWLAHSGMIPPLSGGPSILTLDGRQLIPIRMMGCLFTMIEEQAEVAAYDLRHSRALWGFQP